MKSNNHRSRKLESMDVDHNNGHSLPPHLYVNIFRYDAYWCGGGSFPASSRYLYVSSLSH
ncbi:hypothetical protein HAX54_014946, partial [Datura stramonium]|nr:hypothetical protein [Datura stramonium]